jgi:hypothetical protein
MTDGLDVSLEDDELLSEIRLVTEVIIVASGSEGGLTPAELDEVLGVGTGTPGTGCVASVSARTRCRR